MKFLVLGHKGMLGQVVSKYFSQRNHEIVTTDIRFTEENLDVWTAFLRQHPEAIILNCIGRIKQKTEDTNDLLWANATLPLQIVNAKGNDQIYIHPSTDCIFDGNTTQPYAADALADALDAYGWSKRLGEVAVQYAPNSLVIRVSIIGPDHSATPKGLLGWFLSQPPQSTLRGFDNHLWNGITTLEWCKQLEKLLETPQFFRNGNLVQLGTAEDYSKYEMLKLFQKVYETNFNIEHFATPTRVDRRLKAQIICAPLGEQLEEIKNFL